ncbi:flagellar P-ring protein [Neiella marina]|uniref:Flagellar P-ring protein n=1 Tax=Neiella marina TaxID=508461 RepID=A0A8J2UAQ9_9GAMM|nr:flagellar basal body P-ring protein FlgI [Neiella marina]GGA90400.1 flagellar P-ring protein [Neiella marina]
MIRSFTLLLSLALLVAPAANAERIKDITKVQGVRDNQIVGYGLVVGLPGTGEQSNFTEQSFRTMLSNFGITLPSGSRPKIKNVAAVAVHATMPAFVKPGQTLDVTVSSVGSAESLRGGTLLQTFLKGVDGKVYAIAQGNLSVSGFSATGLDGSNVVQDTPTAGRIPSGAIVERAIESPFSQGDHLTFNLDQPDFSTAMRVSEAINELVGPRTAMPLDGASIKVLAPRDVSQRVAFLALLEDIQVEPADTSARVVVNARTGTIVIGKNVTLLPAAITHGGLTVTIAETQQVSQANPFAPGGETVVTNQSVIDVNQEDSRMFKFDPGTTLDDLVRAINAIGVGPSDVMAILEALKEAGALRGDLIII